MIVSPTIMKNTMSKVKLNPKLKELASKAGYSGLIYEISAEGLERFAKLIIDECAVVANRAENNDSELRCMSDVIHEHFGV